MRRLGLLACALVVCLLLGTGCLTDADKKQWREALKDLRGDNMEMGSHKSPQEQ
jgi:hypothetical protein